MFSGSSVSGKFISLMNIVAWLSTSNGRPRKITSCCEAAAKLTELNANLDKVLKAVSELDVVKQQYKEVEEARKEILAMKSV